MDRLKRRLRTVFSIFLLWHRSVSEKQVDPVEIDHLVNFSHFPFMKSANLIDIDALMNQG